MAAKKKKPAKKTASGKTLFGFDPASWTAGAKTATAADAKSGKRGFVFYFGRRDAKAFAQALRPHLPNWLLDLWIASEADAFHGAGRNGPVWAFRPPAERAARSHEGRLEKSAYARARDQVGTVVGAASGYGLAKLIVDFRSASLEEERGALVGLELGRYSFGEASGQKPPSAPRPKILLAGALTDDAERGDANATAEAVNVARHLVNLPPADLNPRTYAEAARAFFAGSRVDVEIWEGARLKAERMNLLLAVGRGAAEGPRLVRLRYRPKGGAQGRRPVAVVGKGITFDTGGLDIKPSSGMRLMKKDMGGSAAVMGLLHWAEKTGFEMPIDGYLALAENAVDANAFHPSDVIESRAGLTIEIHNTDAEGRLVLADALDVAATQTGDDKPLAIVNVATLTGAIKVALGSEVAGLFSNDDGLAGAIEGAGQAMGDLSWRMPLFAPYKGLLKSTFADMANATDGFGGAITAALFLEPFVRGLPWAHLDVYSWRDSAGGAFSEGGGSGQPTQALIESMRRIATGMSAEMA